MKVILYRPKIPQNTGNIVRTCHATGVQELILVKPLGFKTDNASLKRAGLDYWEGVKVKETSDLKEYLSQESGPFYFFSSKASQVYSRVSLPLNSVLIFGSETEGLPSFFHENWADSFLTIPMRQQSRCLNLSNAVAIAIYEVLRQNSYTFLSSIEGV